MMDLGAKKRLSSKISQDLKYLGCEGSHISSLLEKPLQEHLTQLNNGTATVEEYTPTPSTATINTEICIPIHLLTDSKRKQRLMSV